MERFPLVFTAHTEKEFHVRVESGYGEGHYCELPFWDETQDWRLTMIKILHSEEFCADSFDADERNWMVQQGILTENHQSFAPNYLSQIGQALYQALFKDAKLLGKFEAHQRQAERQDTELHLRLKFDASSPERSRLVDYPWELLHDGQDFLLHKRVRLSRYIAYTSLPPPDKRQDQIEVLLISPRPEGFTNLPTEQQPLATGLQPAIDAKLVQLDTPDSPTYSALKSYLTGDLKPRQPQILHFDGHGLFGTLCPTCNVLYSDTNRGTCENNHPLPSAEGYLIFEDDNQRPHYVSAKEFAALLNPAKISLVVLSACESAMMVTGDSVFNGMAQNLINHRIPAVVAMQYVVHADAASQFVQQFYRLLGQKLPLVEVINRASRDMGVQQGQWYRPVLYLRWQNNEDGHLFAQEQPSSDCFEPSPESQHQPSAPLLEVSIPYDVPYSEPSQFVGRDKVLDQLHRELEDNRWVAITGMGGVGKTELAIQYAQRHQERKTYPGGICLVHAQNADSVGRELVDFAERRVGLSSSSESMSVETKLEGYWQPWGNKGRVLLILDNVTQASYEALIKKKYLPRRDNPQFKILITTLVDLSTSTTGITALPLPVLRRPKAMELFGVFVDPESRIKPEKWPARGICNRLGYLPLGVELVGRYLKEKSELKLKKVHENLQKPNLNPKLLDPVPSSDMTAQLGVISAFNASWEQLGQKDLNAQWLGCLFSLFALAPIPVSLIERLEKAVEQHASYFTGLEIDDLEGMDAARSSLLNYHLLVKLSSNTYQFHRLMRLFLRDKLTQWKPEEVERLKRLFCQVIVEVAHSIPTIPTRNKLDEIALSIPHLVELAEEMQQELEDEELIDLFLGLGRFHEGKGLYSEAKDWYEKCRLAAEGRNLAKEHPGVIQTLNALADVNQSLYLYRESASCYLKAYKRGRKRLERLAKSGNATNEDWINFAQTIDGLGYLYLRVSACRFSAEIG